MYKYNNIDELLKSADRRNLLPTSFEEFIINNYGDFESYLNSADVHLNDYADLYEEEAKRGLETYDENLIEERAEQLAIESLKKEFEEEFYNVLNRYEQFTFPMFIYRALSLPVKNIEEIENMPDIYDNIGIYWSYDYSGAISHWAKGDNDFILKAVINEDDVNWDRTIDQNMNPALGREEKELQLVENTIIEIISIKDKKNKIIEPINMRVKA